MRVAVLYPHRHFLPEVFEHEEERSSLHPYHHHCHHNSEPREARGKGWVAELDGYVQVQFQETEVEHIQHHPDVEDIEEFVHNMVFPLGPIFLDEFPLEERE